MIVNPFVSWSEDTFSKASGLDVVRGAVKRRDAYE
jgi:hypothetical protein